MFIWDVQVLGAKRKTLAGFSTATAQPHQGFIFNSDVIQQTPPGLRGKASRMVGAKCTLLARMDAYGQDPSGQAGEAMKVWGSFWTVDTTLASCLHCSL